MEKRKSTYVCLFGRICACICACICVCTYIYAPYGQQKRATRCVCMLDANGNPDAERKRMKKSGEVA